MYRIINLFSVVFLLMLVTSVSSAGEILWGTAPTGSVFHGATGNGVTDDLPAIQAEVDRLALLPEPQRILRLPPGNFRIGDTGGAGQFYTGSIYLGQKDGFRLIGAGRGLTNLIVGSDDGQNLITICDLNGGTDCSAAGGGGSNITKNTYISDLSFVDNDPIASGGQNSTVLTTVNPPTGGTPVFGELVYWIGGSAYFFESGASVGSGTRHVIGGGTPKATGQPPGVGTNSMVSGVPPVSGQAITGASGWTATIIATNGVRLPAVEGTHGFNAKYSDGLVVERIGCVDLSDECIDIQHGTSNVTIRDVTSTGVGSVDEGGSTISISGADNVVFDNFQIDMGSRGIYGPTRGIDIATNNTTNPGQTDITQNVYISNGTVTDTDALPDLLDFFYAKEKVILTTADVTVASAPACPSASCTLITTNATSPTLYPSYGQRVLISGTGNVLLDGLTFTALTPSTTAGACSGTFCLTSYIVDVVAGSSTGGVHQRELSGSGRQANTGVNLYAAQTTSRLNNIQFDNVQVINDAVLNRAVIFGTAQASPGEGEVTFSNSHISGAIAGTTLPSYSKSTIIDSILDGERGVALGFGTSANVNYINNILTYPGSTTMLNLGFSSDTPVRIVGNTFNAGSTIDCIVSTGDGLMISKNLFYSCGGAVGDHAVQLNSASGTSVVTGNIFYQAFSSATGFRAGDGTGAGCITDGIASTTNLCDNNIVYVTP